MSDIKTCAGCSKEFEGTLSCPTCIKLGLTPSYFCSQDCFKASWGAHKAVHKPTLNVDDLHLRRFNGFSFTGNLRPASLKTTRKTVSAEISQPDYAVDGTPYSEQKERNSRNQLNLKQLNEEEQSRMREACILGRKALDLAHRMVAPGVTCEAIDDAVHDFIIANSAYPSPLNYYNFPKSCCTSVNEVICHGIPDSRPLEKGDIINVDISVYHKGMHADLNETFYVGGAEAMDEESKRLVQGAYHCLAAAIKICKPGVMYRDIGDVCEKIAKKYKLSVVRTYCGHGINELFHCNPNVPHYAKNKAIGVMKPGHTFTIEPMLNLGVSNDKTWPDDWTSVTADGKRSSQFEHTLLITETGVEVLTRRLADSPAHDFELPEEFKDCDF